MGGLELHATGYRSNVTRGVRNENTMGHTYHMTAGLEDVFGSLSANVEIGHATSEEVTEGVRVVFNLVLWQ